MAGPSRIDELRKKFDENPRRYFAPLANEYRKIGDFEQAIFICQEFLPQQPGHMSGHIVYGQALFESGRHDEARAVFETALSLDPENLIALRQLGDIARAHGDNDTARAWYRRVLDSDPRNDEIAGILTALDSDTPIAPPSAPASGAAPEDSGESVGDHVIEKTATESAIEAAIPSSAASPDPIVTEPLTSAPAESNFDDIAKLFTAPTPQAEVSAEDPNSGGLNFVHEGEDVLGRAARMAEPENPAAPSPRSQLMQPESPLASLVHEANAPSAVPSSFLENLTTAEPPPPPSRPLAAAPPDLPPPVAPADASTAFVTETMAELYVQQGHRDRALDVYRQLVKLRPNEPALAARLRELEGGAAPSTQPPQTASAKAVAEAGPTIRDFLTTIAGYRLAGAAEPNGSSGVSVPQPAAQATPQRPASNREETVGGSLHSLFAGAEQNEPADLPPAARTGLTALVTMDGHPPDVPMSGRPATPAATELSLDHVFRHATPAAGSGSQPSFSFDQFFSQQAQKDVAAADAEPASEGNASAGDDIQQFNAWLEGLKKT
jgi:tetratricopeptide (TPR) repeat protein